MKAVTHSCHARQCDVSVPPKMLMCRKHWRMVPAPLKRAVWREYVPGQEIRKNPTDAYLEVSRAAIVAVYEKEQASHEARPYVRCQDCGAAFAGGRKHPFCEDCDNGQTRMFDTKPAGFEPVVTKKEKTS